MTDRLIDPDYQPPVWWLTAADIDDEGPEAFKIHPNYPYNIIHERERSYVEN